MEWKREEEEKPEFGTEVLAWKTCNDCRDKIPHAHIISPGLVSQHGQYLAKYNPPDIESLNLYKEEGNNSYDYLAEPHWHPEKPSHWQYIDPPDEIM